MTDPQALEKIITEIGSRIGEITGIRVYTAISDPNGKILAFQDGIEPFKDLIENFVGTNFPYMKMGDHSIPLSGHNLIFFRTEHSILALYGPKGKYGQLLSFKAQFPDYAARIDELIEEVPHDKEIVTQKIVEKVLPKLEYQRKRWDILPIFSVKLTGKEKIPLDEATLLTKCDGNTSIRKIAKELQVRETEIGKILLKYHHMGWIRFPNYYPSTTNCPICKAKHYLFIPKMVYERNPSGYIRMQLPIEGCDHTFTVFIDKNMEVKTQKIEYFLKYNDSINLFDLSIEKLYQFFGQDVFSNIFHTLILKKSIIFIEEEKAEYVTEFVTKFLKKIFPNLEYGKHMRALTPAQYAKEWKKFKDHLIIDLGSNIVINEPYEQEKFEVISEIIKNILLEEDEKQQILKLNQELERIMLLAEPVITIAKREKGIIVEAELIEKVKEEFNIELRIHEIPLIKKLTKAYLNEDISRKVVSELAYSIW